MKLSRHQKWVILWMVLYDIIAVNLAGFFALWIRFDGQFADIPYRFLHGYMLYMPFYTALCIGLFAGWKTYSSVRRFVSFRLLDRILSANVICILVQAVFEVLLPSFIPGFLIRMPISFVVIGGMAQMILTVALRFMYRFARGLLANSRRHGGSDKRYNVMLIGAGSAGQMIIEDIFRNDASRDNVVCIIDDDRELHGMRIDDIPIVGGCDDILYNCEKYGVDKILLAIPSMSAERRREVLGICKESGCEVRSLPGIDQLSSGTVTIASMKPVNIEDLLGRDPIRVDLSVVYDDLHGKTIMVTGGGGSIGSELCRQIAGHDPKQLIIFDVYENNAYDIQLELQKKYPDLDLVTLIGSVRDSRKMFQVFETYKPDIVYHAAAHKHVPLMEDSPCESIKNNVFGTYKTAYAAMAHGCSRFVLVSTDKAVNPTNIMGASKRLCEMVIQAFAEKISGGRAEDIPQLFTHAVKEIYTDEAVMETIRHAKTEFVAVRFGNVLGSNGSVIPLFKRQIEAGGPVTVTHPDIIRYFMTIPEAVSLVLTAGACARNGEIYVLDMGEPVKIDTLARNMIKLSGFRPDVDIKIIYTGLRPGEKLYEEKLMAEEGLRKTDNALIHIGCPIPFDTNHFLGQLSPLMDVAYKNKDADIRGEVQKIVSTYHPAANSVRKS